MRKISASLITNTIKELCLKANIELRHDVYSAIRSCYKREKDIRAKKALDIILENAILAKKKKLPICQDTGMVVVYLKLGQHVLIKGNVYKAIQDGVRLAYKEGYFRKSIVKDPLMRENTHTNLPAIIYTGIMPGSKVDLRVSIKGFGCENAGRTRMFRPTDKEEDIERFIVDSIKDLGSRACPPMYIGIGIGGTLDKAVSLSKEATLRPVGSKNASPHIRKLETRLLEGINKLNIGPMGMGGGSTALGVSILTYPTHIAGLPVALSVSCHATRDARKVI